MRFIDQDIDVRSRVEVFRHVAELVNRRHDDAAIVFLQQTVEPDDAAAVFKSAQSKRSKVLEHLVFQLVAVDHQKDGRLVSLRRAGITAPPL